MELLWFGEKCYLYEGWEHIEIVLLGDLEMLNVCVLVLFFDEGFSLLGILVKISLLKGEYEWLLNLMLVVIDGKIIIKFYLWFIEEIVVSE